MGMDVVGIAATAPEGRYFRNSIWWWRPLWQYCTEVAPGIVSHIPGDTNDGAGLERAAAEQLATILEEELSSGRCRKYAQKHSETRCQLPTVLCGLCSGTGIRTDGVGVAHSMPQKPLEAAATILLGRDSGWCNGCGGEGRAEDWRAAYILSESNVEAFAKFCRHSGGFMIY